MGPGPGALDWGLECIFAFQVNFIPDSATFWQWWDLCILYFQLENVAKVPNGIYQRPKCKICENWVLLVFLCQNCIHVVKSGWICIKCPFWLFLGQFGHSGSPAWAHMTVPFGSTHTKNTFKCPRHLHRQKKSQKTNYFRSKPRLAKNWLKTWLKLAKNATDQKTDLTCRTGSLCHFQKWSYFLF